MGQLVDLCLANGGTEAVIVRDDADTDRAA